MQRTVPFALVLALTGLGACDEPTTDETGSGDTGGDADTDADTDADSDADTDADSDADTDADTDPQDLVVTGLGAVEVPPGTDYFDVTADGIPPFSYSRHTLTLTNQGAAAVTLDAITATATGDVLESEWTVVGTGLGAPEPLDAAGTVIGAGEAFSFDIWFVPQQSGLRTDDLHIGYDGSGSYDFTVTGRGRDALSFSAAGADAWEKVHGDPAADTLSGGAAGDGTGATFTSGNVSGWSDVFSDNLVVSRVEADGSLGWAREWNEPYSQRSPDSGQNAETGGVAESIAVAGGKVYVAARRSQASSNNTFQAMVLCADASTGALSWARGFSPENVNPPALAWHSSEAYAVDATLTDRVIVTGTSFGNAEVLIYALAKSDGHLLWARQLDVVAGSNDRGHTLAVDAAGNAWIGGIANGRGMLARITGVNGNNPTLGFVRQLDMGTGSNVNSIDLDAAGNAYLSLDRRGATTHLSAARVNTDGSLAWARTFNDANSGDNDNSHVIRVDDHGGVYLGGRVAVPTADTQYADGFLMRMQQADGAYDWGSFYYTGKGAEEMTEHRVKGILFDAQGDLRILMQSYTNGLDFEHYWGHWYGLMDDPMADLTLGEDPGDGADLLVPYALSLTDVTSSSDLHAVDGAYNGHNVATVFTIDGTSAWHAAPASVTYEDLTTREGDGGEGDNVVVKFELN